MKKIIGLIVILATMTFAMVIFKDSFRQYKITVKDENLKSQILFKGLDGAIDFTQDNIGNYYIAYKDKIQYIEKNGKSYNILSNKALNISSIDYDNEMLYYASDTKIYSYNIHTKEQKQIIKNIPNYGDYKDSLIKIRGEYLFVTIGAASNSGVVGKDNKWIEDYPQNYDITPKTITIKGINFGQEKTGAFVLYGTRNIKGQIVTQHFPGNSSIIIYNLKTAAVENYAWGIRNIKGIDFTSESKLIVTVGGIEDRGLRPIKGDTDYIYEIKKNAWYGFPDYTGGDPVNSPKFKIANNKTISFILDTHPTTNPPAPIYQHKALDSLGSVAIDKKGILGEENCIYFYENNDNSIYSLNKVSAPKEKVKFQGDTYISSMKFFEKLIVLDSKNGYMISVGKNNTMDISLLSKKYIYYLLVVAITLIISILVSLSKKD